MAYEFVNVELGADCNGYTITINDLTNPPVGTIEYSLSVYSLSLNKVLTTASDEIDTTSPPIVIEDLWSEALCDEDIKIDGYVKWLFNDDGEIVTLDEESLGPIYLTCPCDDGYEGCTPGFWKQPQHFGSWASFYEPVGPDATLFSDVFQCDDCDITIKWKAKGKSKMTTGGKQEMTVEDPTLLQALEAKGGCINALVRHAVASLLNASNPDVLYPITADKVINDTISAIVDGDCDIIEDTKDILKDANELGCPLSNNN